MKVCDVMLKKADKKKDRQILFAHKHELADKIRFTMISIFCSLYVKNARKINLILCINQKGQKLNVYF